MEDRREFDARLKVMDQKLDDHGQDLREIRNVLITIASQAEKINSLQAQHNELRGTLNEVEIRVRAGESFRAACPASSIRDCIEENTKGIKTIWVTILSISGALGAVFIAHIFGGKP